MNISIHFLYILFFCKFLLNRTHDSWTFKCLLIDQFTYLFPQVMALLTGMLHKDWDGQHTCDTDTKRVNCMFCQVSDSQNTCGDTDIKRVNCMFCQVSDGQNTCGDTDIKRVNCTFCQLSDSQHTCDSDTNWHLLCVSTVYWCLCYLFCQVSGQHTLVKEHNCNVVFLNAQNWQKYQSNEKPSVTKSIKSRSGL